LSLAVGDYAERGGEEQDLRDDLAAKRPLRATAR